MEIKSVLIPTTWLKNIDHGYACGYVGVPPEHPWFNQDYMSINCDVHGGLTWGDNHLPNHQPDGFYYFGFDTNHLNDNQYSCDKSYCEQQLESLKQQAIKAAV